MNMMRGETRALRYKNQTPSTVLPYSGLHLALLLLLSRGRELPHSGHLPVLSEPLDCPNLFWPPTARLNVTAVCLHISFHNAYHYRLSTHVIRFWLPNRMISLHTSIDVFLFTQLEHDASVKGQHATCASLYVNRWIKINNYKYIYIYIYIYIYMYIYILFIIMFNRFINYIIYTLI